VAESCALDRRAWVRFEARVDSGAIAAVAFQAWGCPHFLAACELAAGWLEGRPLDSAAQCSPDWLSGELQVPADKLGRLLVIEDALRELAAARPGTQ
jgi:NifU-like protein involved in Fe-S cluster formation